MHTKVTEGCIVPLFLRQGIDAPCRGNSTNDGTEREGLVDMLGK